MRGIGFVVFAVVCVAFAAYLPLVGILLVVALALLVAGFATGWLLYKMWKSLWELLS